MTKTQTWIAAVTKDAASCTIKLPWERGLRRQAMITNRKKTVRPPLNPIGQARPAA